MTITDKDLMSAILAMDSYHRGVDGTNVLGEMKKDKYIANLEIINNSDDTGDTGFGFFAQAYKNNATGEITISYRGTDGLSDVIFGWPGGGGYSTPQATAAADFYQTIIKNPDDTPGDLFASNVSFTGHSLGGGLAGLMGAIYHQQAIVFDNMPFELSANNVSSSTEQTWLNTYYYGDNSLRQSPFFSGINAYATKGEVLEAIRVDNLQNALVTYLDSHSGFSANPLSLVDLHSQALLVNLMFADKESSVGNAWNAGGELFIDALFDNGVGTASGSANAAAMLSKIAYSAIEASPTSTTVFGDTAVRAMWNDAEDLGGAITGTNILSDSLQNEHGASIAKIFVQYAGHLAENKILKSAAPNSVLAGVLDLSADKQTLTVLLNDATWADAGKTDLLNIVGRDEIISSLNYQIKDAVNLSAISNTDIHTMVFSTGGGATAISNIIAPTGKVNVLLGSVLAETLQGSSGNDILIGNGGGDSLSGGGGDDILTDGNPAIHGFFARTFDGGNGTDLVDFSASNGAVVNLSNNTATSNGASYTINNIENVLGGKFNDIITGDSNNNVIFGGASSDVLKGGIGYDTYNFSVSGDGADEVTDSDGLGSIVIGNTSITGGALSETVNGEYTGNYVMDTNIGRVTFTEVGSDLSLDWDGNASGDNITIKGFNSGDLGIEINNTPPTLLEDHIIIYEGGSVTMDLLANDYDIDGTIDPSSFLFFPTNGAGTYSVTPAYGVISFTGDTDYLGTSDFAYAVFDNSGNYGLQVGSIEVIERPEEDDDNDPTTPDQPIDDPDYNDPNDPNNPNNPNSPHHPDNTTPDPRDTDGDGVVSDEELFAGRNLAQETKYEKVTGNENYSFTNLGPNGEFIADYNTGPIALKHFKTDGNIDVAMFDEMGGTRELVDVHLEYVSSYNISGYFLEHRTEWSEYEVVDGTQIIKLITNNAEGNFNSSVSGVSGITVNGQFDPIDGYSRLDSSESRGSNNVDFSGDGNGYGFLAVSDDVRFDSEAGGAGGSLVSFSTNSTSTFYGSYWYDGEAIYADGTSTRSSGAFASGPESIWIYGELILVDPIDKRFDIKSDWTNTVEVTYAYLEHSAPITEADLTDVMAGDPVIIDVLANDTDIDPTSPIDGSTLKIVSQPLHGTATIDPVTNKVTYTSTAEYNGLDTFSYTIADTRGLESAPQEVTISVTGTILGTPDNDSIGGSIGNDSIMAGDGDDTLNGNAGDDTLDGGTGNNRFNGSLGSDISIGTSSGVINHNTYVYNTGDGNDIIYENAAGIATIELGADVGRYDVSFVDNGTHLDINFSDGGSINVDNQYSSTGYKVDSLKFADQTAIDLTSNSILQGNLLTGTAGNDFLYGDSRVDTFNGGLGNDELNGGQGNDIYEYNLGDGNDTIVDYANQTNAIKFGAGIAFSDLTFSKSGSSDLLISLPDGGSIKVFQGLSTTGTRVSDLVFNDGTIVDIAGKGLVVNGTAGWDYLDGTDAGDTISGFDGNDNIYANSGDDIIIGGGGSDTIRAGDGDDIFVFEAVTDSTVSGMDTLFNFTMGSEIIDLSAIGTINSMADLTFTPNVYWGYTIIEDADVNSDFSIKVYNTQTFSESEFIF